MKIKKENFVISLAFLSELRFGQSRVFASGIPTVDVSAITQAVFAASTAAASLSDAASTVQHCGQSAEKLYRKPWFRHTLKYDLNLRNLIPQDVQSRLNSILSGTGTLSNLGETVF